MKSIILFLLTICSIANPICAQHTVYLLNNMPINNGNLIDWKMLNNDNFISKKKISESSITEKLHLSKSNEVEYINYNVKATHLQLLETVIHESLIKLSSVSIPAKQMMYVRYPNTEDVPAIIYETKPKWQSASIVPKNTFIEDKEFYKLKTDESLFFIKIDTSKDLNYYVSPQVILGVTKDGSGDFYLLVKSQKNKTLPATQSIIIESKNLKDGPVKDVMELLHGKVCTISRKMLLNHLAKN